MARPVKKRRICGMPPASEFAPCQRRAAGAVNLTVDEYEVIRLIDYLGFTQEECAGQMNVARTTVQSIYETARKKLADVLVNGKRLEIGGGSYDVCDSAYRCCPKSGCAREGEKSSGCEKTGDCEKTGCDKRRCGGSP